MKNLRVPFIVALVFALIPAASVLAGKDNQQTESAPASQKTFEPKNFAVEIGDIGKTSKLVNFAEQQKTQTDAAKYPAAHSDLAQVNLAPAQKIQVDQPAIDLLKTKFEGPNLMEAEGAYVSTRRVSGEEEVSRYDRDGAEAGDEVLTVFEHGDIKNPVVIGSVWNSKDPSNLDSKGAGDSKVPWQKHKNSEGDEPTLEFKTGEPKALDAELMFDSYESKTPATTKVDLGPKLGRVSGAQTPALLRPRAKASESSAISSLRTLVSSQAMFYQGEDGEHELKEGEDYGTDPGAKHPGSMFDNNLGAPAEHGSAEENQEGDDTDNSAATNDNEDGK